MKAPSVLLLAVALTASCATVPSQAPGPGASGSARADQLASSDLLADAIYAKLNADPVYYYRHVDVRVDQGVAHLSGYVWSADAIFAARRLASSVPGVTAVVTSQLELERNGFSNGVTR